ncbi:MAG: hypothetical protein AAGA77_24720 [Bacteroidota bacterium]
MTDHFSSGEEHHGVNKMFWVIAIAALIWNLMGLISFLVYFNLSDEAVASMSEARRLEYENFPLWLIVAYGTAVVTGVLGSIALLLKKSWAVHLFITSFIAVGIQFSFGVMGSVAVQEDGAGALVVPVLVIVFAGLLWYYSKKCVSKGWLQ